jgi:PAS domain S-box-containing protein
MDNKDLSNEELLYRLNDLFELLDILPDAVFEIDIQGKIIYLNEAGLRKLDFSSDNLAKGNNFFDFIEGNLKLDHSVNKAYEIECVLVSKKGISFPVLLLFVPVFENDKLVRYRVSARDISQLKQAEKERQTLITKLEKTIDNVKTLRGFLPICAHCKKIRDDTGKWRSFENYVRDHTEVQFSHSLCPDCTGLLYPDLFEQQSELEFDE